MKKLKIGVFGCGNMGRSLVLGIKSHFNEAEFFLFTPSLLKARELAFSVKGISLDDISMMPLDLDWYILAFKPQSLADFQFNFLPNSKIISVLAGVNTSFLMEKFKVLKIARLMPNTPSSIGEGVNLLYLNQHFNADQMTELNALLSSTGSMYPMKTENELDLTTVFTSSGPALIFELAGIFEAQLTRMTNGSVPARELILKTFLGSALLMNNQQNAKMSFEDLKEQVTSKKGVTYEALKVLNDNNLQAVFCEAFEAAYKRIIELSK